jgi:hypothetical protein
MFVLIIPSGPTVNENATASCASAIRYVFFIDDFRINELKRSKSGLCIEMIVLCPVVFAANRKGVYM